MSNAVQELKTKLFDVNALYAAMSMLDWDQQTYMPKGGAHARAEHSSILARMAHEAFVSDETQRLLENAGGEVEPGSDDAALVRIVQRDMRLRTKFPSELVARKSKLSAEGHEAWVEARQKNDFTTFAPILAELFEITKEEANLLGYTDHIYDALIDMYEEGATHKQCQGIFDTIRGPIVDLVRQIKESPNQPDDKFLYGDWPTDDQRKFTEWLLGKIGFDMDRGRQDTAPHPFCTGWSIGDIRLTTRFKDYLPSAIFGTLHEAGHGMYEQGSPMAWDRTPLAGGVSLGIHESQSRLWENIVGRSEAFVNWMMPEFSKAFPALEGVGTKVLYKAINKVEPSFIRVEADEVTYNLHIMVRFEVECAVLEGRLDVKDMPAYWNSKYEEYLGITPRTDSEGCLQDVHWSMGSIGYFPTYTMGNLLSYQFWNCLETDIGDTNALISSGNFAPILDWLIAKVYSKGSKYPPQELVPAVTGKPMGADDYLARLTAKYKDIYGIA